MSGGGDADGSLAEALSQLEEAMRSVGGTTTDPDLRRAAARLAELVRSEDDELERFAHRHFPGRTTDMTRLRDVRELVLALSRLLALLASPDAGTLISATRMALLPRLEELEAEAAKREAAEPPAAPHDESGVMPAAHVDEAPHPGMTARMMALSDPQEAGGASDEELAPFPLASASEPDASSARADDCDPQSTTQDASDRDYPPRSILPFAPAPDSRPQVTPQPHDNTVLPFGVRRDATPPLSMEAPLPPHLAAIDMSAHANFSAMLLVFPDRRAQIYAQFGIRDDAEQELLDHDWQSRLHADETLAARWTELHDHAVDHYRTAT